MQLCCESHIVCRKRQIETVNLCCTFEASRNQKSPRGREPMSQMLLSLTEFNLFCRLAVSIQVNRGRYRLWHYMYLPHILLHTS